MTKFLKYSSIENSYRSKSTAAINDALENIETKWVLTEKIHGTNLSLIFSKDAKLTLAKRSGIIKPDEMVSFFRSDIAYDLYVGNAYAIADWLEANDLDTIQIYGEWFGGGDSGDKTPRIQKEINYGTDIKFAAFDIRCFDKDSENYFMDYEAALDLLESVGIPCVPQVAQNLTFEEALNFNVNELKSVLSPSGDIVEGVIMRPIKTLYDGYGQRAILKLKSDVFQEKKTGKKNKVREPKQEILFDSDDLGYAVLNLGDYVTKARFDNMLGNLGTDEKMPTYIRYFSEDVFKDFLGDFEDTHEAEVTKSDRNRIKKILGKRIPKDLIALGILELL